MPCKPPTHKAADLPPDVRSAVGQILGRPVWPDEEIGVVAVPPRMAVSENLNRRAAKVGETLDEEIDAAVDEAVDRVRHSRK